MTEYVMASPSIRGPGGRLDPQAMSDESLEYLIGIVRKKPTGRQMGNGIAAANAVLTWARWREERDSSPEEAITALMGSPEKALAWMETMIPRLRAKVRGALVAPEESTDGEAERTEADSEP